MYGKMFCKNRGFMASAIKNTRAQFFEKTALHQDAVKNKTHQAEGKIQTAVNRTIGTPQYKSAAGQRNMILLAGGLGLIGGALLIGALGGFGNASGGCTPCTPCTPIPCP